MPDIPLSDTAHRGEISGTMSGSAVPSIVRTLAKFRMRARQELVRRLRAAVVALRRRNPLRIWLVAVGLAAVSGACWVIVFYGVPSSAPYPQPLWWSAISVFVWVADSVTVRIQFRSQPLSFGLGEIPVILGVVYLSPQDLLLAVVSGLLVSQLLQGHTPAYILINIANFAFETAVALVVFHYTIGGSSPAALMGWVACTSAIIAANGAGLLGATAWLFLVGRSLRRTALLAVASVQAMIVVPLSVGLGLVAVLLVWASRWATLLLIGLVACAIAAQHGFARLSKRYASLDALYNFTLRAAQISETDEAIPTLLQASRQVLDMDYTELLLSAGEQWHGFFLVGDAEPIERDVEGVADLIDGLAGSDIALLNAQTEPFAEVGAALASRGLSEAILTTVDVGAEVPGLLVVGRLSGPVSFEEDDRRLVRTVAANAGTAIRGAHLLAEVRQQAAAREHEALHDGLTGLANRVLFHETVRTQLEKREVGAQVGVMLLDLDGFKDVNDTLGHHTGDAILEEVADRLTDTLGARGLVARLGGDEFAFVLTEPTDTESLQRTGQEILQALSLPLAVGGLVLALRASLGGSLAPQHGEDSSLLLRRADVAMYEAKARGGGLEIYDFRTDHHSTRRLLLSTELRQAIGKNDLQVWYQPQASLLTEEIVGCEALLRWHHPIHGEVSPNEFIPAAEQSGLVIPLTWWALETAITQMRAWHDRGLVLNMAVNMSGRSLFDTDVVGRVESLLLASGVDPHWLTLEVTESSVMADQDRSRRVIEALSGLGVQLAIDDFGTGYSSLGRLKRLPIQVVKIDRSFVKQMSRDEDDEAIVRSTIDLARHMGHAVVAEGVEDQETWDQLAALGCDGAQGFLLARAMPAERFETWLQQRRRGRLTLVPPSDAQVGDRSA